MFQDETNQMKWCRGLVSLNPPSFSKPISRILWWCDQLDCLTKRLASLLDVLNRTTRITFSGHRLPETGKINVCQLKLSPLKTCCQAVANFSNFSLYTLSGVKLSYHRPAAPGELVFPEHCFWWPYWWPHRCSCPHQRVPLWRCRGCPSSGTQIAVCPGWQTTGTRWRSTWRSLLRTKSGAQVKNTSSMPM